MKKIFYYCNLILKLNQLNPDYFIMIRNILSLVFITLLITSCGNSGKKAVSSGNEDSPDAIKVEFTSLVENPESYLDKNISVEGKVVHVCLHTGKRMSIVGENPDIRLYVSAGEEMPRFPAGLLGSEIVVEGTLTKAVAAEATTVKDTLAGEEGAEAAPGDSCETEAALVAPPVLSDLMMIYNRHTIK